jgi:hypothetical protein
MESRNRAANGARAGVTRPRLGRRFRGELAAPRSWRWLPALAVASALLLSVPAQSATNQLPLPSRRAVRTNQSAALSGITRTNAPAGVQSGKTNVISSKSWATNLVSSLSEKFSQLRKNPAFMPVVIGLAVLLLVLLLVRSLRGKKGAAAKGVALRPAAKTYRPKAGQPAPHACNVLEVGTETRRVWQFDAKGGGYAFGRDHTTLEGETLPRSMIAKDWRSLLRRKLNIAWLPAEQVFLRAEQFPRSDFEETLAMVELQLEKLSPMPIAQIVWSIHILPHAQGELQTVIVMIVARNVVEEFLGRLEGEGYLADRLELPLLDQLQTTAITEDGAWIYPEAGGSKNAALIAWWYGGVLRSLDLVMLPSGQHAESLKEQLLQTAWAGELEGWLSSPPNWHLVADAVVAGEWEPVLRQGLEQPVEVIAPPAGRELAALTARRAAHADPRASLMPPEFALRYQQQFVDRLWMRGLLGVAGLYVIGVVVYLVALGVANWRTGSVEKEVAQLGPTYTNAVQLKARYQVLKERQELKYAALDCWNATARNLPEGATLDTLIFSQGKRLSLHGTAPNDAFAQLTDFESKMRKSIVNGQPLFDPNKSQSLDWRVSGSTANWTLGLELKRSEVQ